MSKILKILNKISWRAAMIFKLKIKRNSKLLEGLLVQKASIWKKLLKEQFKGMHSNKVVTQAISYWNSDFGEKGQDINKGQIRWNHNKICIYALVPRKRQSTIKPVKMLRSCSKAFIRNMNNLQREMEEEWVYRLRKSR